VADRDAYEWVPQVCPVCERPPTKHLGRRGGSAHREGLGVECEVWRCKACDLVFPNPMPVPRGGVEQHYAVEPGEYFRHHADGKREEYAALLMRQLRELKVSRGRLLDIGAGRGEVLKVARDEGWEAVGVEVSPTFAEHAARYSGAEVRREPVERCGFEAGSFDAVILSAVLEHLYEPDAVVGEVARLLRRGGVLFVDVPNERGLYFAVGNLYQKLRLRDWVVNLAPTFEPYHVFGFSPRSLRKLLAKHGLRPELWHEFPGESLVPSRGGLVGLAEQQAAKAVTALSRRWGGTYIAAWARKA
jgi:2-polyprenyl-3-methyl-5-hydroxy-6-metoxy-1,4-benzoquinol methylase